LGRGFILWSTAITVPAAAKITIDQSTFNNFGRDARNNFFIDCNTNQADISISNSIFANTPMPGQTTGTSLYRASNAVNAVMRNCNSFKLTDGAATPTTLTWPAALTQTNLTTIDLGWTAATTNFTLPAGSPLRTASTSGGPIGDLRWAQ
jgi:hypothetical protein